MLVVYPKIEAALNNAEGPSVKLDPAKAAGFPKRFRRADRAALDWSDDGHRIFLGIKEQTPAPDTTTRRRGEDVADVDVWNTNDERIQSQQMTRADADQELLLLQRSVRRAGTASS